MRAIGLDCLTLPDLGPVELIGVAAEAGYDFVSLWVQEPAMYPPMLCAAGMRADIAAVSADRGVAIGNLEVFNLNSLHPVEEYEAALALGASLGAKTATAIDFGEPRPDIAERLAAFDAIVRRLGMETLVEPISMGATRTLREGADLIAQAGIDGRLVVDLVHVMRTGGTPNSMAEMAPKLIGHVQFCDGPLSIDAEGIGIEAVAERLYPGEGAFRLSDFARHIPAHATIGLEVPSARRQRQGLSGLQRAVEALAALRGVAGLD